MLACRVIPSFLASARRNGFSEVSDKSLRIWAVDMMLSGIKRATCARYLGSLHAAWREWHGEGPEAADDDPFTSVRECLGRIDSECRDKQSRSNLRLVRRLLRKAEGAPDRLTVNIILYLLYNVRATIGDVIALTRDRASSDCPQIDDIVEASGAAPNSKYVFPLGQGKMREARIARNLTSGIHATLRAEGMDFDGCFSRDSLTAMWIAAAMNCGVPAERIRAMVRTIPGEYACLAMLQPDAPGQALQSAIINKVADSINDNTARWHVMRLRGGVSPDDIRSELRLMDEKLLAELTLYYPTRTVVRKEGRRKVREEVPYLPGLLFFRIKSDRVGRLFRQIGHMAWCYRVTNTPDSPYCTIPPSEMRKFQMHIGSLTSDIEMELMTGRPAISVGDSVRITGGGLLEGYTGIIESVRDTDGAHTYSLILFDNCIARWTVRDIDAAYLRPLAQAD